MHRFRIIAAAVAACALAPVQARDILISEFGGDPSASASTNSEAIAMAIDAATDTPEPDRIIFPYTGSSPTGTSVYRVNQTIRLNGLSGVELVGETVSADRPEVGDEVGRHPDWPLPNVRLKNTSKTLPVMVVLSGCTNVALRDLHLHGVAGALNPDRPIYGVIVAGSEDCVVENLTFTQFGKREAPLGGSQLVLMANEPGENGFPGSELDAFTLSRTCAGNSIRQCRFLDSAAAPRASFGVRMMTDWTIDKKFKLTQTVTTDLMRNVDELSEEALAGAGLIEDEFQNGCEQNVLANNDFTGGFFWNAIEIAGPATRNNRISRNRLTDNFQTSMESDKGASFNVFDQNLIDGCRPNRVVAPQGQKNNTTSVAIRDQGIPIPERYCIGNVYHDNRIRRVTGVDYRTGAFLLRQSQLAVITDNTTEDIGTPANGQLPAVFTFRDSVVHLDGRRNSYESGGNEVAVDGDQQILGVLWLRYYGERFNPAASNGKSNILVPLGSPP